MTNVDLIMKYEAGEATNREALTLFADLVKTGAAWSLQGSYGRGAQALIDAGYIDADLGILTRKACDMLDEVEPLEGVKCRDCSDPATTTFWWGVACPGHARLARGGHNAEGFAVND